MPLISLSLPSVSLLQLTLSTDSSIQPQKETKQPNGEITTVPGVVFALFHNSSIQPHKEAKEAKKTKEPKETKETKKTKKMKQPNGEITTVPGVELSFDTEFSWPLDRPDLRVIVNNILEDKDISANVTPLYRFNHSFIIDCKNKCLRDDQQPLSPHLIIVVKSSLTNAGHRNTIRQSWGDESRFSNITIRRIFLVGSCESLIYETDVKSDTWTKGTSNMTASNCNVMIRGESEAYGDIVQIDYIDTYFNNSIKTIAGFEWLKNYCPEAEYALFVDDDFFVSVKNLLSFINNPFQDPLTQLQDGYFPYDGRMYAGQVAYARRPERNSNYKWFISIKDYPFDKYPNFIPAGTYLVSNRAFKEIAVAAAFVKPFTFDDNYLSFIARKIDLKFVHNPKFMRHNIPSKPEELRGLIGLHGYGDYQKMYKIWMEQVNLGNA